MRLTTALLAMLLTATAHADPPTASYVFPAGARRGSAVKVRVGGLYLYDRCGWELLGQGMSTSGALRRIATRWFEGPMLPLPASQQAENYPQDMYGEVRLAPDAPLGPRRLRVWTSEGASSGLVFVVGDLPEVVEDEIDGDPVPVAVRLPVTINGRIFPREDIDVWSFAAKKGQVLTCEAHAARIGSPLDTRLVVRGPEGKRIAENEDARGTDSLVQFTAPADGTYQVQISDSHRAGSQRHVYRLTITAAPVPTSVYPLGGRRGSKVRFTLGGLGMPKDGVEVTLPGTIGRHEVRFPIGDRPSTPVVLDIDDLPEYLESANARALPIPAIANGRIDRPGEEDSWSFVGKKGAAIEIGLRARQLGSPLLGELEVRDDAGKSLLRAAHGTADPRLLFNPPRDGTYTIVVRDRFRGRGGATFAYRLRLAPGAPDFRIELLTDALSLTRGKSATLRVAVARGGGLTAPVTLRVEGLPSSVKAAAVSAGDGVASITLSADKSAAIVPSRLRVVGTATVGGKPVTRTGVDALGHETVLLGVGLPVPFKVKGSYDLRLAPRGTVFRKKYTVDRGGYKGPFEVRLADRQARHLQGVTGPVLTLDGNKNDLEYPVSLPPWMETGRTSRTCLMLIGRVTDGGREHTVSYTSHEQNDQIIAVVETGQLGLELTKDTIAARPGAVVRVPFRVTRGKGLKGPVRVELLAGGVSAAAVTVAADKATGTIEVRFGTKPVAGAQVVRATLATKDGPVIAEASLEVVAE